MNVAVETRHDLDDAFHRLQEERADALLVASGPFVLEYRRTIMRLARRYRLPAFVADEAPVEDALLVFTAETRHIPGRAADYVARILRGARPGDLPIERPTEWRLTVDLRVARALGLTVPRVLLDRAERVIE